MTTLGAVVGVAREITSLELPSWTLMCPFLVLGAVALAVLWRRREAWVQRELGRFVSATGLPDPEGDRTWVVERTRARVSGRLLGVATAVGLALPLMSIAVSDGDSSSAWWILFIPVGQVVGTALGHLRPIQGHPSGPRVASLRPRLLRDYVTTAESVAAILCAGLPVVSIALAAVNLAQGTSAPTPAVLALVTAALSLVTVLGLWVLVRRALRQNVATRGPEGLAWAELLRAQMLRDLVGGVAFAGWFGGAFVLFWGVTSSWRDFPDWYLPVTFVLAALSVSALVVGLAVGVGDKSLGWARHHVLGGSAGQVRA